MDRRLGSDAAGLGLVLDSTQSLCRSLFSPMLAPEQAGRTSSALGPLMFAGVAALTGNQRAAMASMAIFLVAGAWLIQGVSSSSSSNSAGLKI